jgi:thiamine pyrophosphokinase
MNGTEASAPSSNTVLVLAGGDPVDERLLGALPPAATVIAADSGLDQAARLGLAVDLVIGDFDSVDAAALAAAKDAGAAIEPYPVDKDYTDLELAVRAAGSRGAQRVVVVGGWGGRIDHALANLLLLGSVEYAPLHLEAIGPGGRLIAIHDRAELAGAPGDLVTLLAVGKPARGVRTAGLKYPLRGETLEPGSTRGVSNELTSATATVEIEHGTLLAVLPIAEVV